MCAGDGLQVDKLVVAVRFDATHAAYELRLNPANKHAVWRQTLVRYEKVQPTVSLEHVMHAKASAGRTVFVHPEQLTVSARRASSIDEIMPEMLRQ